MSTSPQGWIVVPVAQSVIDEALRMRAERDRRYGNIFAEASTDLRWVGEVGEICFDAWLCAQGKVDHRWIVDEAAGRADFIIAGTTVGIKTVKRQVPMRVDYTAQITARHAEEPVDDFFFASYEQPRQQLWLVGGITRQQFLRQARYYAAGEWVHPSYQIRRGHEIYNIEVCHLTPPERWLADVRARRS